jgi:hypothetical protein
MLVSVTSRAQGLVEFSNAPSSLGYEARVFDCDGVTRLTGPAWLAQLYAGPAGTPEHLLRPVGTPIEFGTGGAAGLFRGGFVAIPDVPPGEPAAVQVRIWQTAVGPRYESAIAACSRCFNEPVFEVVTSAPPTLPAALVGFRSAVLLGGCDAYNWWCVPLRCAILRDGNQVLVSWATLPGHRYALLRARSPGEEWETIFEDTATADTQSVSFSVEEGSAVFRAQAITYNIGPFSG